MIKGSKNTMDSVIFTKWDSLIDEEEYHDGSSITEWEFVQGSSLCQNNCVDPAKKVNYY